MITYQLRTLTTAAGILVTCWTHLDHNWLWSQAAHITITQIHSAIVITYQSRTLTTAAGILIACCSHFDHNWLCTSCSHNNQKWPYQSRPCTDHSCWNTDRLLLTFWPTGYSTDHYWPYWSCPESRTHWPPIAMLIINRSYIGWSSNAYQPNTCGCRLPSFVNSLIDHILSTQITFYALKVHRHFVILFL